MNYRKTYAQINLKAIKENFNNLRMIKPPNIKYFFGVVKANAYGHGIIEVAKALVEEKISCLAVATLDEAILLRKNQIQGVDILVMGNTSIENISVAQKYDISLTCHEWEWAKKLAQLNLDHKIKIHLKINSGMNRLGFNDNKIILQVIKLFKECSHINLAGIFTHFATADQGINNQDYVNQHHALAKLIKNINLDEFKYIHFANSATYLFQPNIKQQNAVRIGLALYGLNPSNLPIRKITLKPAMFLISYVSQINNLISGEKVGYGLEFIAKKSTKIATIAIGYGDGYLRANQDFHVSIRNKDYQIVGRICMDQMMILVDSDVHINDQVELFGENISVNQVAKHCRTINYEIVTLISKRVPRIYI